MSPLIIVQLKPRSWAVAQAITSHDGVIAYGLLTARTDNPGNAAQIARRIQAIQEEIHGKGGREDA